MDDGCVLEGLVGALSYEGAGGTQSKGTQLSSIFVAIETFSRKGPSPATLHLKGEHGDDIICGKKATAP